MSTVDMHLPLKVQQKIYDELLANINKEVDQRSLQYKNSHAISCNISIPVRLLMDSCSMPDLNIITYVFTSCSLILFNEFYLVLNLVAENLPVPWIELKEINEKLFRFYLEKLHLYIVPVLCQSLCTRIIDNITFDDTVLEYRVKAKDLKIGFIIKMSANSVFTRYSKDVLKQVANTVYTNIVKQIEDGDYDNELRQITLKK